MNAVVKEKPRFQRKAGRQPVFLAKVRVATRNGGFWRTIGAAWDFKDGSPGLSVVLQSQPFGWDGRFTLFEPQVSDDVPDHDPDTGEVTDIDMRQR